MHLNPIFTYYLYHFENQVDHQDENWNMPLPSSRLNDGSDDSDTISFGEYFTYVTHFLSENNYDALTKVGAEIGIDFSDNQQTVSIYLIIQKHGAFYHPLKMEIQSQDQKMSVVVNVAISEIGNKYLGKEAETICLLNQQHQAGSLPQVYYTGHITGKDGRLISIFVGEWFDGFFEFHPSHTTNDQQLKIKIWNESPIDYFLNNIEAFDLYRHIAKIFSSYYNFDSTCYIHPWHHASGDFVVCPNKNQVDVRLITARNYLPFLNIDEIRPDLKFYALICYLVFISIHTRLDREDGVRELVWAPPESILPTLRGFMQGIEESAQNTTLKNELIGNLVLFFSRAQFDDLKEVAYTILDLYPDNAPEIPMIQHHLQDHLQGLRQTIQHAIL